MTNTTGRTTSLWLFLIAMLVHIMIWIPGMMTDDTQAIYAAALNHSYADHHPPLMAYLWHYLLPFIPGTLSMYLINIGLLWTAIYRLSFKILQAPKLMRLCILMPFFPWLLIYSGFIWKDIIFTFGFGLLSILLAEKHLNKQSFTLIGSLLFLAGLFYFSSVKFQAKFIAPFLLLGLLHVQSRWSIKACLIPALIMGYLFSQATQVTNQYLVTEHGNGSSHSWQYVKIYDLAGMSVALNQNLLPGYLHRHDHVTVDDIKAHYELLWEPLIDKPTSPLRRTQDLFERDQLRQTWHSMVLTHPLAYLQHRAYIWSRGLLLSAPGKGWFLDKIAAYPSLQQILSPFLSLFSYVFILPIQLLVTVKAWQSRHDPNKTRLATVILGFNCMSLTLLGLLFFFSLAATPRYIYFSSYLFFLSMPFAGILFAESPLVQRLKMFTEPPLDRLLASS